MKITMEAKAVEDMTLSELEKENLGLTDDLGEIINQLDMGLYNTVENPESRISLEKQFIEKTDRKELIEDMIFNFKNTRAYRTAPPTARTESWTYNDIKDL